ncbi:hypothetical protein Droror1_Dr00027065 [Drosera rotundifolia]
MLSKVMTSFQQILQELMTPPTLGARNDGGEKARAVAGEEEVTGKGEVGGSLGSGIGKIWGKEERKRRKGRVVYVV